MTARAWTAVLLAAVGTWATRTSLVLLFGRVRVPPLLERSFRYVAPSVLAALSVPAFVAPEGSVTLSLPHLLAATAGGVVAWRFHSFLGTLAVGLSVYAAASAMT